MKFCVEVAMSAAQGGTAVGPPLPKVGNWTGFAKKNVHFFHSENQVKKKLHITEYSHTLILRSDGVMKFCVEAAVSAAQGGTAVRPPLKVGNWTGFTKKKCLFFSLRKSTEKKFLSLGKSICWHRSQPI